MTCPSELTCILHADGALPADALAGLQDHLAGCAACRDRVAALAAERSVIGNALRSAEPGSVVPPFAWRPSTTQLLVWLACAALAAWLIPAGWQQLATAGATPDWFGWLVPDLAGLGIALAIGLFHYAANAGSDLLSSALRSGAAIVLIGLAAGILWTFARRRPDSGGSNPCISLGIMLFCVALIPAAHAFEVRRDDTRITIAAGETIDDTLIVMSETVLIEGTVTGDLIALGERVSVRGNVGGSVLALAEELDISGAVGGNVLAGAETLNVRQARLGANTYVAGRVVTVHADTAMAGNTVLAAQQAEVHGQVARDLLIAGERMGLLGSVGGNLYSFGQTLELGSAARVDGNLTARLRSTADLHLAPSSTIAGTTDVTTRPEEPEEYETSGFYFGKVLRLLAAFVTGLALFYVLPTLRDVQVRSGAQLLSAAGVGGAVLVATPPLALLAAVTLIGAPLGIVALLMWLVALYLAGIVTAAVVGRLLVDDTERPALSLLAGLVVLALLDYIPVLGVLVGTLALLVGMGLLWRWLRDLWAGIGA